jgi:hypothetical protein
MEFPSREGARNSCYGPSLGVIEGMVGLPFSRGGRSPVVASRAGGKRRRASGQRDGERAPGLVQDQMLTTGATRMRGEIGWFS